MALFTDDDREQILEMLGSGLEVNLLIDVIDDIACRRLKALTQERIQRDREQEEEKLRSQGSLPGYEAACGINLHSSESPPPEWNSNYHGFHSIAGEDYLCFGYCDCKYTARYPHTAGEHK